LRDHLRHHARFYGAALFGVLIYTAARAVAPPSLHLIVAGDAFFAAYLVSTAILAFGATPRDLRQHASYEDEGVMLILVLTGCAVILCLAAIFLLLGEEGAPALLPLALAIASVLLGWFTVHTVAAFRYAHLYYTPDPSAKPGYAAGLDFPGTDEPHMSDFLYYSFVIGMTSQVSDVQTQSPRLRRTTLAHSVVSFFFNTVILALAVNIAAGFAR
jgi:uncharacterized membrane protein